MNYLRIRGILIKREKIFTCGHITEGALTDVLGEYIRERYERLNPDLKDVLSKSAIIGNTFSSELLTSPFGVIHAQELLNKVERISLLIKHESEAIYAFESPESFQVISSSIGENERKQWHGILADFFARRLERLEKGHLPIHPQEAIIYLHSASRHYKFSCKPVPPLFYTGYAEKPRAFLCIHLNKTCYRPHVPSTETCGLVIPPITTSTVNV